MPKIPDLWKKQQVLTNQYNEINKVVINPKNVFINNTKKEIVLLDRVLFAGNSIDVEYVFENLDEGLLVYLRPIIIFETLNGYTIHSYDFYNSSFIWKQVGNNYKFIGRVAGYLTDGPPFYSSTEWPLYVTYKLTYFNPKQFGSVQQNAR